MNKYEDGIYTISNDEYHGDSALSRSALMEFLKSPAHYRYKYTVDKPKEEPTPALIMGDLIHTLVLEPDEFNARYAVMPDFGRKKADLEAKELFLAENAGLTIVKNDQVHQAVEIAGSVTRHDYYESLLKGAKIEQSIFWTDKETGLQFKARPDAMMGSVVSDLKSSANASLRAFQRSCIDYGYFLQCGMVYEAFKAHQLPFESFVFFCVEKEPPYATGVYIVENSAIEYGVELFNVLKRKVKHALENDSFPDYGVQTLGLPAWAKVEYLEDL